MDPTPLNDSPVNEWTIWQLIDSAFPIGGFAHSSGLEAAFQMGRVDTIESLNLFLRIAMDQAANLSAPFVAQVVRTPENAGDLDRIYDCQLTNHVGNSASRVQGNALLSTAIEAFSLEALKETREAIRDHRTFGHLPIVWGLVTGHLGWTDAQATGAYLFCQLRGLISAAVRLGILGPRQAQAVQVGLSGKCKVWLEQSLTRKIDDCAQISPMLDVTQGLHDRLYSRLFVS